VSLVRSRQRVADHGEVFTPSWTVEAMLDLVKNESERVDSRFLEPACGSGNFLVQVLLRKLATVEKVYGQNVFERSHHALLGLMCIYGIELLLDNAEECRANLLDIFSLFLGEKADPQLIDAAAVVVHANIIQGDAISMATPSGESIVFPEWAYLRKGKFARRDFSYDTLTLRSSFTGTLFDLMAENELFIPTKNYPPMSVSDIASLNRSKVEARKWDKSE
jgi:hypothetical protein